MPGVPEQLEKLITERHDGGLSPAELAELHRVLAMNADAAALSSEYERLNLLLSRFRVLPDSVDFRTLQDSVTRRVADEAAFQASIAADSVVDPAAEGAEPVMAGPRIDPLRRQFEQVDEWLQGSVRPMPEVDWNAFRSRVSGAVREEAAVMRRGRIIRWALRAGVPLAAAAALFLAFRQPAIEPNARPSVAPSARSIVSVALDSPRNDGTVTIAYDMSSSPAEDVREEGPGLVIASGASTSAVSDSMDVALLY